MIREAMKIFRRAELRNDPFCGVSCGDVARDTISGFTGVVVARVEYISGCNQLLLLPQAKSESELNAPEWVDVERIEVVTKSAVQQCQRLAGADCPPPVRDTPGKRT